MHYNIFVCGLLIHTASIIDSIILVSWIICKFSLYRHEIKTSQILSLNTVTDCSRKFVIGVRAKSNFSIGDWVSFRAGCNKVWKKQSACARN